MIHIYISQFNLSTKLLHQWNTIINHQRIGTQASQEKFEDTKGISKNRLSKDKQNKRHNNETKD